jgi:hypothetical protein
VLTSIAIRLGKKCVYIEDEIQTNVRTEAGAVQHILQSPHFSAPHKLDSDNFYYTSSDTGEDASQVSAWPGDFSSHTSSIEADQDNLRCTSDQGTSEVAARASNDKRDLLAHQSLLTIQLGDGVDPFFKPPSPIGSWEREALDHCKRHIQHERCNPDKESSVSDFLLSPACSPTKRVSFTS